MLNKTILTGLLTIFVGVCVMVSSSHLAKSTPRDAARSLKLRNGNPIDERDMEFGYVDSSGVKIHYATAGSGPLIVLIHGFPDYWYSWRNQIAELAKTHQVVAIDLRGYNKSDKPEGIDAYSMGILVSDIIAVVNHFDVEKATLIGHDWGAAISWNVAIAHPDRVERLAVLSVPHPNGFFRELQNNEEQIKNSKYARDFKDPKAAEQLTPESLASHIDDDQVRAKYIKAFQRSSIECMLNYYKTSFPKSKRANASPSNLRTYTDRNVKCPVLMIHGLNDKYLLAAGFNDNWQWVEADSTLVMIRNAGHFVQHDAADKVTREIVEWLDD